MEYLDIIDINGLPTGKTVERETAHSEGILHRTSHVWIVRRIKKDAEKGAKKGAEGYTEGLTEGYTAGLSERLTEGCFEFLLQKRCDTKSSFPGCYDISSAGHIPAGVDFAPSAIRELKEELGIDASEEELLYCGDRKVVWDSVFAGKPFHDRQISRVFALVRDIPEGEFTLQKEEVSEVRWMEFNALMKAVEENSIPNCIVPEELRMVFERVNEESMR